MWTSKERPFKVDDKVLVVESGVARGKWNLARVIKVYPVLGGVLRNVKLRTKTGEYKWSVRKCCLILVVPNRGWMVFRTVCMNIELFNFYALVILP